MPWRRSIVAMIEDRISSRVSRILVSTVLYHTERLLY
jgi:hypothetical protein